jgi:hypothetical protein
MLLTFNKSRALITVCILLFLICVFNCYFYHHHNTLSLAQAQEKPSSKNLVTSIADNNNILENLAKQFGNIARQFEYTVDLSGRQIFPNDTLKQDIVTYYKSSTYNISSLKYRLLGFDITASDIKIDVKPSKIDANRTKVDLPIVDARNVVVTNELLNLKYTEINLGPIYGIYNKISDKMTVHIPINTALRYLPSSVK